MPKITDKFKINKISEKTVLNKKDQTIKVFRKDKKKMTMSDIKEFFNHIKKEDKKGKYEVLVRGRNNMRMSTVKGFTQNNITDFDEDYWGGIVIANDIDTDYFYLEIVLRETLPKRILPAKK
jgi:hypothetical protein